MKDISPKRIYIIANKHMARLLVSLACRELQTKTMMSYHYTLIRTAEIKISYNPKYSGGCGESGSLIYC